MKIPQYVFYLMMGLYAAMGTTQAVPQYEVIGLHEVPNALDPYPYAINNQGKIVGHDGIYPLTACLIHQNLQYINLTPAPSSFYTNARSINNNGIIVGQYGEYATIFDATGNGNNITVCDTAPSSISDINDNNTTAGVIHIEQNNVGVTFNIFGLNDYVILGGIPQSRHAFAWALNNHNQIVGSGYNGNFFEESEETFAILFDSSGNGNNTYLRGIYGSHGSAWDINDNGIIVGESHVLGDNHLMRATIFGSGEYDAIDLRTTIDGVAYGFSNAMAINNLNQIVGTIGDETGARFATLFDNTGQGNNIDLNSLIDPESGWELLYAYDINDNGWIIGHGRINDQIYGYLLKPVPEPATVWLVLSGMIFLVGRKTA